MELKFLPSWTKVNKITLVYPQDLYSPNTRTPRETLLDFFFYFLEILNRHEKNLEVQIIFQSEERYNQIRSYLSSTKYLNLRITPKIIPCQDIWIRDWGPISIYMEEGKIGKIRPLKTIYNPDYCPYKQDIDNRVGWELVDKENCTFLPLLWDLGNLETNGQDIVVTKRLQEQNSKVGNIEKYLRDLGFKFNQLIQINVEKNDNIGHIDSLVRFFDEKTILIPEYPDSKDYKEENEYLRLIESQLREGLCLKYHYNIVKIPSDISDFKNKEDIYSTTGCYLNFLRLENRIYLPQYNIYEDDEALRIFKKLGRNTNIEIIPVNNCNKLADLGGVLNCFTNVEFGFQ